MRRMKSSVETLTTLSITLAGTHEEVAALQDGLLEILSAADATVPLQWRSNDTSEDIANLIGWFTDLCGGVVPEYILPPMSDEGDDHLIADPPSDGGATPEDEGEEMIVDEEAGDTDVDDDDEVNFEDDDEDDDDEEAPAPTVKKVKKVKKVESDRPSKAERKAARKASKKARRIAEDEE